MLGNKLTPFTILLFLSYVYVGVWKREFDLSVRKMVLIFVFILVTL